jgi:hypothetical protein
VNALIQAAADLQAVCVQHDWRFCFIGGLAVQRWGEPREKDWLDIDGIIVRQDSQLDWSYVRTQLAPLAELKDAPELVDKLERRRADLQQ